MGYEVLFIRIIALSFGSSTYSFTVMLMLSEVSVPVVSERQLLILYPKQCILIDLPLH